MRACELLSTLGFTAFEFEAHPYVDVTKEIVLEHERQVSCNGRWLMLKLALHQDRVAADQLEGVVTHCRPSRTFPMKGPDDGRFSSTANSKIYR